MALPHSGYPAPGPDRTRTGRHVAGARTEGKKGSSPGRVNERAQKAVRAGTHLVLEWWPERGWSTASRACGWWALKSYSGPGWCSEPRSAHRARPGRRRPKAAGGRAPTSRPQCQSSAQAAAHNARRASPSPAAPPPTLRSPSKNALGSREGPQAAACGGVAGRRPGVVDTNWNTTGGGTQASRINRGSTPLSPKETVILQTTRSIIHMKLFFLPSDYHTGRNLAFLFPAIWKAPTLAWMEQPT